MVGSGGGGLNAAIRLVDEGLSVAIVEKNGEVGGNTKHASVFCNYGGHRIANENKYAVPSYPYDPDILTQYLMNIVNLAGDEDLIRAMAVAGPECIDWMDDQGVKWAPIVEGRWGYLIWEGSRTEANHVGPMTSTIKYLGQLAEEKGVTFLMSTETIALVQDEGVVVGVKAKEGSNEVYYRGAKAVLLTAGGFELNRDMYKKYLPTAYIGTANCPCPPNGTGDCVRMGLGVGADMSGINSTGSYDGGLEWEGYTEDTHEITAHYLYDGATQLARQPWLSIDMFGNRVPFFNTHGSPYPYSMASLEGSGLVDTAAIQMTRPGGRAYICFDSKYEDYVTGNGFNQSSCRTPNEIPDDDPNVDRVPEMYRNWKTGADAAIEAGAFKKCDTLEELENELGLESGMMTKAVEDWNKICEAGEDTMRPYPYDPTWLKPISTPPYYGAKIGGNTFSTKCGLRVNPDMQVLTDKGDVIPGLYAGFHTAGGSAGENNISGRPHNETGFYGSCGCSFVGGYMAATGIIENA